MANYYNSRTGNAPVHVAAAESLPDIFRLLFKYPGNMAEVNALNKDGLSAAHILLAKLIDLAALENKPEGARGSNGKSDDELEEDILNVFDCLLTVFEQRDLRYDFNSAFAGTGTEKTENIKNKVGLGLIYTASLNNMHVMFRKGAHFASREIISNV